MLPQTLTCAICGVASSTGIPVDVHHELHRSQGGIEGPTLLLCRRCHDNSHPEKQGTGWRMTHTDGVLTVVDQRTGELLAKHWDKPKWFHTPLFFAQLRNSSSRLRILSNYVKYLDYEELRQAAEHLAELDGETWQAFAMVLRVALLKTPYGERREKLETIARELGIKTRQAYKLIAALEYLEQHPEVVHPDAQVPPPDVLLLIAAHGDPEKAMELYQDRAAENPRYGRRQFQAELAAGATDSLQPPPRAKWHTCPTCGANHPAPLGWEA